MVRHCVIPHSQCIVECVVQSCSDPGAQYSSSISLCPDFQPYPSGAVGWCAVLIELLWMPINYRHYLVTKMRQMCACDSQTPCHPVVEFQHLNKMKGFGEAFALLSTWQK